MWALKGWWFCVELSGRTWWFPCPDREVLLKNKIDVFMSNSSEIECGRVKSRDQTWSPKSCTDEDEFVNVPKQLRKHNTLHKLDVIDPEESFCMPNLECSSKYARQSYHSTSEQVKELIINHPLRPSGYCKRKQSPQSCVRMWKFTYHSCKRMLSFDSGSHCIELPDFKATQSEICLFLQRTRGLEVLKTHSLHWWHRSHADTDSHTGESI